MQRRSWLSIAMLAIGVSLLVAAGYASPAGSSPAGSSAASSSAKLKKGGTLRVNLPDSDIDDVDPQVAYGVDAWQVQYSTALKLLNYPDAPAPRGTRLVPEAASKYTVSRDGRTYTFTIRKGFRFSDGRPVTARNFEYAFRRAATKDLQSPAFQFIADPAGTNIAGAQAYYDGKASKLSGVTAKGNKLIIRLTKADPTSLAKFTMPFFQAASTRLSLKQKVITVNNVNDLPSAGPYYIASRQPNRLVRLVRNKFYKGPRPRNLDAINIRTQVNLEASYREVRANQADYATSLPVTANAELAKLYGLKGRFKVLPSSCVSFIALNNSNPLFRNNVKLRQAVNFVLNRGAMVKLSGAYAGNPFDQMLPPVMPGYRNANIYPLNKPNIAKAKSLARGHLQNGGKGVYFYGLSSPGPERMELVRSLLKQIGIEITPKGFRGYAIYDAAGQRGSEHAFSTGGWCKDYSDPYDFINVLLYGGNIQAENNNNYSYFNNPTYNKKMEKAARLLGAARYRAYGQLDIDIVKNQAPTAPWINSTNPFFLGARINTASFAYQPIYEGPPYNLLALK